MAELEQAPVGEHDLEAEHGIARDTVLGAQQAARVRRDVAAHGGDGAARGVGGEPQAVRRELRVEVGVDDAGLHDGELVVHRDLEHAVHGERGEHDLARPRDGPAREARAGAARDDGRAGLGGDAQRRPHVVDRARPHDRERGGVGDVAGLVLACRLEVGVVGRDRVPELRPEQGDDIRVAVVRSGVARAGDAHPAILGFPNAGGRR